jgi:LemA protein
LSNPLALLIGSVPALLVLMAVLWGVALYNNLIRSRNRTREAFSGIAVQLKRRSSLIPNLVETVRGYAKHEHEVFTEVAQARGALAKASTPTDLAAADQTMTAALGRLMVVAEAYPQIQAAGGFRQLEGELADTEEKIAYARQFYNQNALDYNTRIQGFPANQVAQWFRFQPFDFYRAEEAAEADVKVTFTTA